MTLEEAIKHAEEVAKENQERANSNILIERNGTKFLYDGEEYKKCYKCAEEHRQLAEWLKDYQRLLDNRCQQNEDTIKTLEQEPKTDRVEYGTDGNTYRLTISNGKEFKKESFINKPCISSGVCEHDKNNVLDKIRAEIEELKPNNPNFKGYFEQNVALNKVLEVIDKYKGRK